MNKILLFMGLFVISSSALALSIIEKKAFQTYTLTQRDWESSCGGDPWKNLKVIEHQESLEGLPKNSHVIGYEFTCTKGKLTRMEYVGLVFTYGEIPGSSTESCFQHNADKDLVLTAIDWQFCGK